MAGAAIGWLTKVATIGRFTETVEIDVSANWFLENPAAIGRLKDPAAIGRLIEVATIDRLTETVEIKVSACWFPKGRFKGVSTVGRLTETIQTFEFSIGRLRIGARLADEQLELELLLELFRGMIQVENFARTFRNLDINIVVGPGAGKNG